MRLYFYVLFIILAAFSSGDVQNSYIELNWRENQSVSGNPMYTFQGAFHSQENPDLPLFHKIIDLGKNGQNKKLWVENMVFEEIKVDGHFNSFIPDSISFAQNIVQSGLDQKLHFTFLPVKKEGSRYFILKKFELKESRLATKSTTVNTKSWKQKSVLESGRWLKIKTEGQGIYRIPFSTLESWGFASPDQVGVYGSGNTDLNENPGATTFDDLEQNTVWFESVNGEDHLLFYAQGGVKWSYNSVKGIFEHQLNPYSEQGYYFLTDKSNAVKPLQFATKINEEADKTITTFNAYLLYEKELQNLLPHGSGRQWFGESIRTGSSKTFSFNLEGRLSSSLINVGVNSCGRSFQSSGMDVILNGENVGKFSFKKVDTGDQTALFADEKKQWFDAIPVSNNLNISLSYQSNGADINAMAWLDYVELNYVQELKLSGDPLYFRSTEMLGEESILAFELEGSVGNTRIIDLTDPYHLLEIEGETNGAKLQFKSETDQLRHYVAYQPGMDLPEPTMVEDVENQSLHAMSTPEFLIISHPKFLNAAEGLADFHRSYDAMEVEVVNVEKVYNEFSSGTYNPSGLRNFIKMFYDRGEGLKYVLLFGDGSYDNRNLGGGDKNYIPTYQSFNSLSPTSSFQSDDYFVMMDPGESVYNGAVDLGIGRIPSSTTFEADLVVEKIRSYHDSKTLGDWKNQVCFIGDDEDNNLHMADSERLANKVNANHKEFITDKIYFDAYQEEASPAGESYPGVTEAINQRVKDGVLVLNYVGHANNRFMADEHVLDVSDVNTWTNADNLPIFVTATCEFSRFDAEETSIGEYVLFNPNGGGIALFSTTRVVFAYSNYLLSQSFYNYVFEQDEQGEKYRMGDIIRLAKVNTFNSINKRNFSLLGDPALRLSYPENRVVTSRINGEDASQAVNTVGALEKISVEGFVADIKGEKMTDFNGEINVTVYDKLLERETLGNGGERPMTFKVQENVIYQGVATVRDGDFNFDFVVPKDIVYSLGNGKIVYYANDGSTDANGAFEQFKIGGPSDELLSDNEGPEIDAYLDSPDFVNGGVTSKSPMLYADLYDENGINTVGSGIGHDITAVIDGDYSEVIVLNEYYEANLDDYKSGKLAFPLSDLSEGIHTIRIKVWDVANNSSEVEIQFEVSGEFFIEKIENYPNPVMDYTNFIFSHNQSGEILDVIVEVFDITGKRIDLIKTEVGSNGKETNPIRWDLAESNIQLRGGVYLYRIMAQNRDGRIAEKTGKLISAR